MSALIAKHKKKKKKVKNKISVRKAVNFRRSSPQNKPLVDCGQLTAAPT